MTKKSKTILFGLAFIATTILVTSCVTQNSINSLASSNFSFANPVVASSSNEKLKFSLVITATVEAPEAAMFEGGSWFKKRKMGHSVAAICHMDGLLLLDTGLGEDIATQFEDMSFFSKLLFSYDLLEPAAQQLEIQEYCPDRPIRIVLSHLHWDHASGIEDFQGTPVWTGPAERDSAIRSGNRKGYLQNQFDSKDIDWQTITYSETPYLNYNQSSDVFGDGSVILVPMKGHTEGSVGLFLTINENQKYFFTGDTTWSLEGFERPAHKHALMRAFVDGDVDGLESEIQRVNALIKHDPSLIIIPAHDFKNYPQKAIYPNAVSN